MTVYACHEDGCTGTLRPLLAGIDTEDFTGYECERCGHRYRSEVGQAEIAAAWRQSAPVPAAPAPEGRSVDPDSDEWRALQAIVSAHSRPAAPAPEADDTPTWLLEQQRKDDHETVVLGIIAAPEWLDADGVRGMLIDLLGECDDATLGRMAALCITRYAPPSPTAEPDPDEASREYPF